MKILTPWMPGDIRPIRRGVYERRFYGAPMPTFSHWNGYCWGMGWPSIQQASERRASGGWGASPHQSLRWRGLARIAP